jgi:hypothetical protein
MIEYRRNNEDLKTAIREHTISGYPLKVPVFEEGRGLKTSTVRDLIAVVVEPVKPITIEELSTKLGWNKEKKGQKAWIEYARGRNVPSGESLKWIHPRTLARLEDGYKVSDEDIKRDWARASGHIDKDGNVLSYSFDMRQVQMHPEGIEPGMIVEFLDGSERGAGIPGRVVGVADDPEDKSKIIYLETFEPVPSLMAPKAMAPWLIQPTFVPDKTWVIGYGTLEAMKRKKVEIPPGMFDPKDAEKRVFFLDQPIPLAVIEDFCKKHYPDEPKCVWQSMTLMVIPIHPARDPHGRHGGGIFKPFPDDTQRTDIQANIDYYGEGMEFEE